MAEILYGLFFLGVVALVVGCFAYLFVNRDKGGQMKPQLVMLYQPDDVLASRIPGGAAALSGFIQGLQQILAEQLVGLPATSRALVAALTPGGHGFWLLTPTGPAPELPRMHARLDNVPRPRVLGPVAFALLCNLGEDFPVAQGPPAPPEWIEVVRGTGDSRDALQIDEVLSRLLG